jgi:hypothetical protein
MSKGRTKKARNMEIVARAEGMICLNRTYIDSLMWASAGNNIPIMFMEYD